MTLFLFPNLLGRVDNYIDFLPESVEKAVQEIDGLIVESWKGGRLFLSHFELDKKVDQVPLALFNKHNQDIDFLLEPILQGEKWGLISDSGMPCIADPGAKLVLKARESGITIKAFPGPSSITMALMQSGLPGQRFSFHGYLPKKPGDRLDKIGDLIKRSKKDNSTQIFIEAPHRNMHTLNDLLNVLPDNAYLCVACELTLSTQIIITHKISNWKKQPLPPITKKPTIFLFYLAAPSFDGAIV